MEINSEHLRHLADALAEKVGSAPQLDLAVLLDALDHDPESVSLTPELVPGMLRLIAALVVFAADAHARYVENVERIVTIATQVKGLFEQAGEIDARLTVVEQRLSE